MIKAGGTPHSNCRNNKLIARNIIINGASCLGKREYCQNCFCAHELNMSESNPYDTI